MRAVRFSAQLGYFIEAKTLAAIRKLSPSLERISRERIQVELVKLLVSPHPEYLRTAYDNGVTQAFLPEFDQCMVTEQNHPHHCYSVGEHILHSLNAIEADRVLRLAMLFHDMGKPAVLTVDGNGITHFHGHAAVSADMAKTILQRLKFDNDTIHKVCRLVLYHDYGNGIPADKAIVRRALNKIGPDAFPGLFAVKHADISGAERLYETGEAEKSGELAQAVSGDRGGSGMRLLKKPGGGRLRPDRSRLEAG